MATKYGRIRIGWGTLEVTAWQAETPSYASTQMKSAGASAVVGSGTAVRRCSLEIDRSAVNAALDPAYMHFDFMNVTAGDPDDTWIDADFTTLEAAMSTFWSTVNTYVPSNYRLTRYIWHRAGKGITKPNPAVRAKDIASPVGGLASSPWQIPQAACSITFRTGVRKSWGRTYLPFGTPQGSGVYPFLATATVDAIAAAADALVATAATNDFLLVVTSKPLESALTVESVEVDNVLDVIRRRRPKKSTYKKILST